MLFYLMFKAFKQRKTIDILAFGALTSFSIMTPAWIIFIPPAIVIYLIMDLMGNKKHLRTIKNDLLVLFALAGSTLIFNAFMVLPTFFGAYLGVGRIDVNIGTRHQVC